MNHQITERLENYPHDKAKARLLELQIQRLEVELKNVETVYLPARSMDGMPHGNGLNDTTGCMATRLADGYLPPEAAELKEKLDALKKALSNVQIRFLSVDIFLDCLNEKEKFVITGRFFKNLIWNELVQRCESGLGIPYSMDTLKRLQKRTFEKGAELIGW